ncbi:uncharacterized protein LOC120080318 [Benincasa hispida]|uniref:uncharacterized protein LOC120080318 n=1 Tax=Benincasa hispida TaxID=102211 RepID=UPI001900F0C2|nr:uncharacterized protein LOC120080318 [Benincasa hispida]XP_038890881.1 uncharacterized protein LOC120080318 [Benincasa hispida]
MVFPSNMMSRLTCLKILKIERCKLLEGVFEVQESNTSKKSIDLLPSWRHLELIELSNLQYIWEKYPCELLNVKNIEILFIRECPKFKRKYPHQLEQLEIDLSELEEILKKEKSTHMLKHDESETSSKDEIKQLLNGRNSFFRLKCLKLYSSFDYRSTHLPMEIVQILHNLEEFEVRKTLFEEVFPIERLDNVEEWQNERRYKLSSLNLSELPKLRHLWNGDLQKNNSSIFQNLTELNVSSCGILNMSMSSSMWFRNLRWLMVEKCHKLTYLLNPSVARSMVQLLYLVVNDCKRMTTVIARGVEEENDEILFKRLFYIRLKDLPKLRSFHSEKRTIKFPTMKGIHLQNCPEMRDFSLGIVSTPRLFMENIGFHDSTGEWCPILKDSRDIIVEDINVTIQQAWEDHENTNLQCLFEEENFEENQCDPLASSSHVEELESNFNHPNNQD